MSEKSHGERLDRLEQVVQVLAEDQLSLQKLIAQLARETRKGFDRVAEQFAETDRRMRETDAHLRETDRRMCENSEKVDARINQLVIAMGAFISRQDIKQN